MRGRRHEGGFTLIELVLSLGLFSLLLVGLLQLLDTSTGLWKEVDARRDETEVAGALGDRLARDLSTLEAGPEGDFLVDWGPIDVDKNGTAGLYVARLRFVRRAAPSELALLRSRQADRLDAAIEVEEQDGGATPDWERLDRGLVETCWVLASAGTPLAQGAEPVFDGVLLRGERFLDDPERISIFDERFLPAGSGHGRPTVGMAYLEYPKYGSKGHRTVGNLYLSLMQAAGMKTSDTFGQPDANLKDLDLKGPLQELMVG